MKWGIIITAAAALYLLVASLLGYALHRLLPDDD